MENEKYLSELHTEHKEWISELSFVKDELESFKNRLSEVVRANTSNEVLAPAEHFQNQFIRHFEVIDELVHDINEAEHKVVLSAKKNNVAADNVKAPEDMGLVDRMETFQKIYKDLKQEYMDYLSKVH